MLAACMHICDFVPSLFIILEMLAGHADKLDLATLQHSTLILVSTITRLGGSCSYRDVASRVACNSFVMPIL